MDFIEILLDNDKAKAIQDNKNFISNTIETSHGTFSSENYYFERDAKDIDIIKPDGKKNRLKGGKIEKISFAPNNQSTLNSLLAMMPQNTILPQYTVHEEFRIIIYPGIVSDYMFYTYRSIKKDGTQVNEPKNKNTRLFKIDGKLNYDVLYKNDPNYGIVASYSWICRPNCQTKFYQEF